MVKRKSDRLKLLQKLATQYEQMAAKELGRSANNLLSQQERLEQLRNFRTEYTNQFRRAGEQGMDVRAMMDFQNFLHKLDTAIQQQEQTVHAAQQDQQSKKTVWEGKHITTQVYDKTLEKTISNETRQDERKQQLAADDRAQHIKNNQ